MLKSQLLWYCLWGSFHFPPMKLSQETVASWVTQTNSKAYPRWAVAADSTYEYPWGLLPSSSLSPLWQSRALVSYCPRPDLLLAAGGQPTNKASQGLKRSFVVGHFSPCTPLQDPGWELNASAGNVHGVKADAVSKGSPDGGSLLAESRCSTFREHSRVLRSTALLGFEAVLRCITRSSTYLAGDCRGTIYYGQLGQIAPGRDKLY